uniref:hypothetical protein n=1 Tax=Ningiella ruwaisensis TaxID=2364274 RepID=UPI0010A00C42|nr:hypothetical protein [Ningiella ruwaisensis]
MFGLVLFGCVLFHALYRYMVEKHMPDGKKPPKYALGVSSFLVLFLLVVSIYTSYFRNADLSDAKGVNKSDFETAITRSTENVDKSMFLTSADSDKTRFVQKKLEGNSPESAESAFYLPVDSELNMVQQFTSVIHSAALAKMQPNIDSMETKAIAEAFGKEFTTLLIQKDWTKMHLLIAEYSNELPDSLNIATNLLLMYGAPMQEIEYYLGQGAEVSVPATLSLIANGQIDEMIKLENYGVSYSSEQFLQMSMLDLALMNKLPPESFDFLLARVQNVSEFKKEIKVDTLAIALLTAEQHSKNAPKFISSLLKKDGVNFTEQHRAILDKLKKSSPDLADDIIAQVPDTNV